MLPLGLRVQDKIEQLIDRHMKAIGASKVSLSSLSSQDLWQRSGRLEGGTEFFKFTDRKGSRWLLNPTHEEEITILVGAVVQSFRDLPIRLYQISRKYRDERRPRGGLLRGREFLMKDLYTFDLDEAGARDTYDDVRNAYAEIFDELKLDYISVRADSGSMGGSLSHEYHLTHPSGEDDIILCANCGFAKNEELIDEIVYEQKQITVPLVGLNPLQTDISSQLIEHIAVSQDGLSLVKAYAPRKTTSPSTEMEINTHAIKHPFAEALCLDTGVEDALQKFINCLKTRHYRQPCTIYYLFDHRIENELQLHVIDRDSKLLREYQIAAIAVNSGAYSPNPIDLLKTKKGNKCPNCNHEALQIHKAIEVGHTFHLGTRYSAKLGVEALQPGVGAAPTPVEMGCHGIGVSRLIAAVAACLSDERGLNWPRILAPYQVAVCGKDSQENDEMHMAFCESLTADGQDSTPIDVLLDDRPELGLAWKLNDADMIGYPVIVVFGRAWESERKVEIQCRRLNVKTEVLYEEAPVFVQGLLRQL